MGVDTQVQLPPQNPNERKDETIFPNCLSLLIFSWVGRREIEHEENDKFQLI